MQWRILDNSQQQKITVEEHWKLCDV